MLGLSPNLPKATPAAGDDARTGVQATARKQSIASFVGENHPHFSVASANDEVVAVVSMKGVGKTTLTANLAGALAQIPAFGPVWTIDLDPQNAMHWHLGLHASSAPGICSLEADHATWSSRVLHSANGVGCLPYGAHGGHPSGV